MWRKRSQEGKEAALDPTATPLNESLVQPPECKIASCWRHFEELWLCYCTLPRVSKLNVFAPSEALSEYRTDSRAD